MRGTIRWVKASCASQLTDQLGGRAMEWMV